MSAQLGGIVRGEFGPGFGERSARRILSEVSSDRDLMSAQLGGSIRVCLGQVNPDQNNPSSSRIENTSKDTEHRENLERQKQTTRMRGAAWHKIRNENRRERKPSSSVGRCLRVCWVVFSPRALHNGSFKRRRSSGLLRLPFLHLSGRVPLSRASCD